MTFNSEIFGLPIPDAGPIFAAALVIHILSGLTAVIAGALAATAGKRAGRHPRAGRVYLWALGGIFATATIMAAIRWHEDAHLFAIAVIAFSLGLYGYRARRQHRPAGRHTTPSAWVGPTSPYSPAFTSTTAHSYPCGTGYPTSPTGSCPASSEYRSSGGRCAASPEPQPTSQATIRRMLAVLSAGPSRARRSLPLSSSDQVRSELMHARSLHHRDRYRC
jgi:hypothetical protein